MKKIIIFLFLIAGFQQINAQSYKIMNSAVGTLVGFEALVEDSDLFGYIELRKLDLTDKLTESYKYTILDKNMNTVSTGEFVQKLIKKKCFTELFQISYSDNHVLISFKEYFDNGSNVLHLRMGYQILNLKENKIIANDYFDKNINIEENIPKIYSKFKYYSTIALTSFGYIVQENMIYNKKYYAIDFEGKKIWDQPSKIAEQRHEFEYSFVDNDKDVTILLATKKRNNKKVSDHLLIIDSKTGKEIAFTDLYSAEYTMFMSTVKVSEGKIYIAGKYFEKDKRDNVEYNESLGLYRRIVDIKSGKIDNDAFVPYAKFGDLNISENGKIKREGYLSFQKINRNPDGSYFVIAEPFIPKSSGPIFSEVYVFQLDKDFNPFKIKAFDTNKTRGSKYSFSQDLANNSGKAFFFYDKNEDKKAELNILNLNYTTNEFSLSKMPMYNEKSDISVVRAKTGYIGIVERYRNPKKDEKTLEIRLEKLNIERN